MATKTKTTNSKTAKPTTKKERKARTGTKMLAALDIIKANPNSPRKVIIQLFIDKAKLTKAGASTYYQLCQKKLAAK